MNKSSKDKALTPETFKNLKITKPQTNSVGFKSVVTAISQVSKYMNPVDTFKLALKMNQKGGFDCPGCAWPDPDDERSSLGEFCLLRIAFTRAKSSRGLNGLGR